MRWSPKGPLRTIVIAATAALVSALVAGPALAQDRTVEVRGGDILNPSGQFIKNNFRFQPKSISVTSGSVVRWVDNDESDAPHTVTIADPADLPSTIEELDACFAPGGLCIETIEAHDPGLDEEPPFTLVVNTGGPGLDARGDSLLFAGPFDEAVEAQITAPAGSTLAYLCVLHPWMQGSIKVRG
jgi:plastocyanin